MTPRLRVVTLLALLAWGMSTVSWAAPSLSYVSLGVGFSTPVEFSQPQKWGVNAEGLLYPATAKMGQEQMSIVLVRLSQVIAENMKQSGVDPFQNLKGTYLGLITPAPSHCERAVLGRVVRGDAYEKKIPRKCRVEAYPVTLPGGDLLLLAFEIDPAMDAALADGVVDTVTRTLVSRGLPAR